MDRVVIDGYNVLHAHPWYADLAHDDLETARARLVSDLAGHAQGAGHTVVVFDGGANPLSDGAPHHIGQLTVIFSPAGYSADSVIEGLAARARERGERLTVVTSDGATRSVVRSGEVSVLSASAFIDDLIGAPREASSPESGSRRVGVAERIAPDVRDVLASWAREGADPRS